MKAVPEHFFRQSAILPYRYDRDNLEVLLITSRRRKRWVIPKGVVEPDLTAAESAAKEALEEAGIEGDLQPEPLGTYRYEKWGGICSVTVFAMAVTSTYETWPESYRSRLWLDPAQAAARVDEPDLKAMILRFAEGFQAPRG
jgi:phosphohistidine phosphatase